MRLEGYRYDTFQDVVRRRREKLGFDKWGFVIYRCTYTSQAKWDDFLSYIKEDASDLLRLSEDTDLRDSLEWTIFEDKSSLDGISWKEARVYHDKWVVSEIEKERAVADKGEVKDKQDDTAKRVSNQPRYGYFIYVDEAAVDSVIGQGRTGAYYITLAKTRLLFDPEVEKEWVEAGWLGEEEKGEGYQWFKAWDIVKLFAAMCRGESWENHPYVDGEEICEVVSM